MPTGTHRELTQPLPPRCGFLTCARRLHNAIAPRLASACACARHACTHIHARTRLAARRQHGKWTAHARRWRARALAPRSGDTAHRLTGLTSRQQEGAVQSLGRLSRPPTAAADLSAAQQPRGRHCSGLFQEHAAAVSLLFAWAITQQDRSTPSTVAFGGLPVKSRGRCCWLQAFTHPVALHCSPRQSFISDLSRWHGLEARAGRMMADSSQSGLVRALYCP